MDILERNASVIMATAHLAQTPLNSFSDGYGMRWYQPGDEDTWVQVQGASDRFNTITRELFIKAFGTDETVLAERVGFLVDPASHAIGTATAWIDPHWHGKTVGQVHWVAIVPEYQGKGLAKPMLSAVCQRLLQLGQTEAYLETSTGRIPAINLYRSFGFEPVITNEADRALWREVGPHLKVPLDV